MSEKDFTWIQTYKQLAEYLSTKENDQPHLIEILKSVGIGPFRDRSKPGEYDIELDEIDPFTFYCFLNKYKPTNNLKHLQALAEKLGFSVPTGLDGLPSSQPQAVWMFTNKYQRVNNEIARLWSLFKKSLNDSITDEDFDDVLKIRGTGKVKLTEVLFYVKPDKFFPIDGPTIPYLKEVLNIDPKFKTYSEYQRILNMIREKSNLTFHELSREAYLWNETKRRIRYWHYSPGEGAKFWNTFKDNGIVGIGWDEVGDLTGYDEKDDIYSLYVNVYGNESKHNMNSKLALYEFSKVMKPGDIIIAKRGKSELLGYGKVISDYIFDESRSEFKHIRNVEWKKTGNWMVGFSMVLKVLTDITDYETVNPKYAKYVDWLMAIMDGKDEVGNVETNQYSFPLNTIFYGPPGTGKTYNTILRAVQITENNVNISFDEAMDIYQRHVDEKQIEFVTFHQNFSYEDFIQGLRPDVDSENDLSFQKKDGVFKLIADRAMQNLRESERPELVKKPFDEVFKMFIEPLLEGDVEEIEMPMKKVSYFITGVSTKSIEFRKSNGGTAHTMSINTLQKMYEAESILDIQGLSVYYEPLMNKLVELGRVTPKVAQAVKRRNYVIIIDEINRANISRVFGELITLIEDNKRSDGETPMSAKLPSGDTFMVPSNLYLIGTMNTADKSIALLDIALRRRFEFEAMYPIYNIEGGEIYDVDILKKINEQIIATKGHDFQIGHSFFMGNNRDLVKRMNNKVIPLLMEYYMNDYKEVRQILRKAGLQIDEEFWPLRITGMA